MSQLLDLVRSHGIELRKASSSKGGEYQGPCPGCGDAGHDPKTGPSDRFHVWPDQNQGQGSYWCRQCGKGGDVIQFLRDFDGLSFREACARVGRDLPDDKTMATPEQKAPATWEPILHMMPEQKWQQQAFKLGTWAMEQLLENQDQLDYLAARGINEESVVRYGIGWNPGEGGKDLFRPREGWGLLRLMNPKTGKARRLWLPIGMVIPYFVDGVAVRLRIRRPEPREFGPPYFLVPGSSMATMILNPDRKAHIIVEAELDGILVAQEAGDLVGVVALGSASTKPDEQSSVFLNKSRHILNALDFDGAGAKYWPWWERHYPECERWPVQKEKDPGEAFKSGVNIREWVKAGLPRGLK